MYYDPVLMVVVRSSIGIGVGALIVWFGPPLVARIKQWAKCYTTYRS